MRFCRDFVLGFVLGKFLDSLGKLAEELAKNNENQIRSGGVWGRIGAAETSPKNLRKSSPDPPKTDAKTVLNGVQKQGRISNRSW